MSAPTPPPFHIAVFEEPGAVRRVEVRGELDLLTADELAAALRESARDAREVVLDLRQVDFIDSSGIALLVRADAESRRDGFGFAVLPSDPVRRVVAVCGLDGLLPLRA